MHSAHKYQGGFTFIEIIVVLGILGTLLAAIFTLVSASYETISFTKARTTALSVATEKMENLRNLPYDALGTLGGIPNGEIPQTESIIRNGQKYDVKTSITYVDDSYDNYSPNDPLPTDYKRIRIEVNWSGIAPSDRSPVSLISDISPKGIETTSGGGTLEVTVFTSNAIALPQANVLITADTITPQVNLSLNTDDSGKIILPGATACDSCYKITVTKDGYNTERTYSTDEVANPAKPNVSIIEGQLTQTSFAIDKVSNLTISTKGKREDGFPPIPNVNFVIRGEKIIGTDIEDQPVIKYDEEFSTNQSGEITIENLEWDNYSINILGTNYNISGTNPLLPINILPDTQNSLLISLAPFSQNSYLFSFVDSSDNQIQNLYATLEKQPYKETTTSGVLDNPDFGQVFFSSLEEGLYTLTATMSGYLNHTSEVNVSGNLNEKIIMNKE